MVIKTPEKIRSNKRLPSFSPYQKASSKVISNKINLEKFRRFSEACNSIDKDKDKYKIRNIEIPDRMESDGFGIQCNIDYSDESDENIKSPLLQSPVNNNYRIKLPKIDRKNEVVSSLM